MYRQHLSLLGRIMQRISHICKSYTNLRNSRIARKRKNVVEYTRKEGAADMELWTPEHTRTLLPSLAVMLLLAAMLRCWLLKKTHHIRMIPLKIIAVILVILEIGKQGVSLYRGYDLYNLPFHFCSLFIFAMPALAFYNGKQRQKVYGVVSALCAALTLLMLIYPNLIYPAGSVVGYWNDYMCFHTVTFHNLVMLAFFLLPALNIQEQTPKGAARRIVLVVSVFCAVSATMAHLLKTNYANFYHCNVPVFEQIRQNMLEAIGTVPTQLIYVTILTALNILFVMGAYWFYRALRRLLAVKHAVASN